MIKNLIMIFFASVFLIALMKTITNPLKEESKTEQETTKSSQKQQYSSTWQTDLNRDLLKTLLKNKVRGCGQLKYKPAIKTSKEYLVYCTRDGTNWHSAYIVWTRINKVMGPYNTDPKYD